MLTEGWRGKEQSQKLKCEAVFSGHTNQMRYELAQKEQLEKSEMSRGKDNVWGVWGSTQAGPVGAPFSTAHRSPKTSALHMMIPSMK